jgi:hypothetical protein
MYPANLLELPPGRGGRCRNAEPRVRVPPHIRHTRTVRKVIHTVSRTITINQWPARKAHI